MINIGPTIIALLIADIGLYSVGITDEIDESFLAAISGDIGVTNGQQKLGHDYFKAPDFQALDSMLETVSSGICETSIKPSESHPPCVLLWFYAV